MSLDVLAAKDVILLDAGGDPHRSGLRRRSWRGRSGGSKACRRGLGTCRGQGPSLGGRGDPAAAHARELWDGYFSRVLSGAGLEPGAIPAALEALWSANRRQGLWRRPLPGVGWALEALHRSGRRLAVVSNAEGQVEADLRAAGLSRWLETVVDSHLVGVAKPDPEIFAIALRRLGVGAEQAFYVGDVPAFDVEGARRAGLPAVLIDPWGVHEDCDAVRIASLAALPALLGGE
ncbi:MAG: HAD-IA family hydrolase [Acidobacteriota bacterium]|nr:HAD-IA family hydrolase [Acidobacteriota bacterium]